MKHFQPHLQSFSLGPEPILCTLTITAEAGSFQVSERVLGSVGALAALLHYCTAPELYHRHELPASASQVVCLELICVPYGQGSPLQTGCLGKQV